MYKLRAWNAPKHLIQSAHQLLFLHVNRKSTIVAVIEGHMTTADSQIIQKEQNVLSKPGAQQRV